MDENTGIRYRELFNCAPDATFVVNESGSIVLANAQAENLFGYSRDEFIGKNIDSLVPKHVRTKHPEMRAAFFQNPCVRPMGSGRCLRAEIKDGTLIDVEISLSPLRTPEGLFVSCSVRDISAQRKLEMQLRQSQKIEAIGRLAGGISHDFNNLLTVILGRTEMMISDPTLSENTQKGLVLIHETGRRAAELTRQLLQFSRQQVIEPRIVDLNQVIRDTTELLRRLIGDNIDFSIKLHPELGKVRCDASQIEQVVMNLVINAHDAMPTGGSLSIETKNVVFDETYCSRVPDAAPGPHVMMSISDTGIGMDEKTQTRIFEPFFTTKEQGKGTGLGLATVYGIVKQAGGHIFVYSEPGHGTTFKVYLPECMQRESAKPARTASPKGTGETILIVEDTDYIRDLIQEILSSHGYKVLIAKDGEDALRICRGFQEPINLLLTDVVMPRMNGRDLADQVVRTRSGIKVLFMSGYTRNVIIHHGIVDEGVNYLEKPFTPTALIAKIHSVLAEESSLKSAPGSSGPGGI